MHIFGAMAVQNKTNTMLDVSIVTDGRKIDFGVLVAGGEASMGGGQFELGKELKVVWLEDYDSDNPIKGEAFFDTAKFADIADTIKEIEFVYLGKKKWKLKAYRKIQNDNTDKYLSLSITDLCPRIKIHWLCIATNCVNG
jgi:hypothetical protein